jgi:flagellar protein FliS
MSYAAAKHAYTEASVKTAPPERLIVMLYDGAIRFLTQAAAASRASNLQVSRDRTRRALAIIDELNLSLNVAEGGQVAQDLRSIYLFCKRHLSETAVAGDPASGCDTVVRLLAELRGAWDQVVSSAALEPA